MLELISVLRTQKLALPLIGLMLLDVSLTLWALLNTNAIELNPVASWIWRVGGIAGIAGFKAGALVIMLAIINYKPALTKGPVWGIIGLYILIGAWNIVQALYF